MREKMKQRIPRLRQLSEFMPKNVKTLFSSSHNIEKELPTTDLIIGAVLIPGAKAPHLITRPMLKLMKKGTVLAVSYTHLDVYKRQS